MTQTERLRLFVAVDVPGPHVAAANNAVAPLRRGLPQARWTSPESQHVTLKFLGWTPEEDVAAVGDVVKTVAAGRAPAPVSLAGVGAFPSARRARVLWFGLEDREGVLPGLAADLDRALEPLGFTAEARAFTPHLTLARFKVPVRLGELPAEVPTEDPFVVSSVRLYRSRLHPAGARYDALSEFPLAPAPHASP